MPASLSAIKQPTSFGGQPGSQSASQPKIPVRKVTQIFGGPGIPSPGLSANQIISSANIATGFQRKRASNKHEVSKREGEKTDTHQDKQRGRGKKARQNSAQHSAAEPADGTVFTALTQ